MLDADEDAVGDAPARTLPVGTFDLVAQSDDLAAEHVGSHPVLVAEVGHSAAVPLHVRRLAVLVGAPVVEVQRVLVCEGLKPARFRAQVALRALDHRLGGPCRTVHERLGSGDALVLARRADEDAYVELAFDASLEGLAVDLGCPIELEDLDLVVEYLFRRHDVRQEVEPVVRRVRGGVEGVHVVGVAVVDGG